MKRKAAKQKQLLLNCLELKAEYTILPISLMYHKKQKLGVTLQDRYKMKDWQDALAVSLLAPLVK